MNAREIFANALRLATPAERAAYLDAACAGDPRLRAEVEALLRAHADDPSADKRTSDAPWETAADGRPAAGDSSPTQDYAGPTGEPIGPYKLIQEIGEGGMGTVWMAQQTEPVKRLVALKLIKAGMDSHQVIARFEAERQALALMDHPNIARVLDAGTAEGRPYFVMELVKGVPITRYCDEHHLTPRQRLELFVPVCQAIQHAHQKGIIHRDIKPSNVLVALYDGRPVPKVIDFGVAKAVGQPLTDRTLVTGFGTVVGTLEYMSPEQAELNQLDIDTRSDIYSLGVLLYELLTGGPPFSRKELERAGVLEMLRVIREREPARPSTKLSTAEGLPALAANRGTEPAKLTKLVRGELDWIVMKCLEKNRASRYETANGLALDLLRYLADEPVQACPPSAAYRLRKLLRRNKGPVLAASLVLLALVGGIVATTLALLQARDAADRAGRARESEADARRHAETAHEGERRAHDREKDARVQADAARVEAEKKSAESRDRLVRHYVAAGARLVEEGDLFAALPWLAEALKEERGDPAREDMHRVRLAGVLGQCPQLRQVWFFDRYTVARHAVFSPDGRHVLISVGMPTFFSGHRGEARVWDAATGQPVTPPLRDSRRHPVWHAEFSPDGKYVVTASGGNVPIGERTVRGAGEVRVWDAKTGETAWSASDFPQEVRFAGFSADGRFVMATGANSGVSQVWEARTGREFTNPVRHTRPHSLAFSPDGRRIAVGSWMQARLVEATGQEVAPLPHAFKTFKGGGGKAAVEHTEFSRDGARVVTASADETARVWDAATGKPLTPPLQHHDSVGHASFSPDGKLVVTASDDGMARVWNAETGELLVQIRHTGHVTHAWFSPDGKSVATISGSPPSRGSDDNCYHVARVWDAATGRPLTPPLRHGARVTWASFSPDGGRLLTTSADRTARVWELAPAAESVRAFETARASHGAISPDSSLVVAGGIGEPARVWNVAAGTSVPLSDKLTGWVQYLAFSPDGRSVLTANGSSPWGPFPYGPDGKREPAEEYQAQVYDVPTGRAVGTPLKHKGHVLYASFSPDGRRVATASEDKTARVWDVTTGLPVGPPLLHAESVRHATFSPDGRQVVTAAWDDAVRVWDASSGEQIGPPIRAGRSPCYASFTPDGRHVFVTGYDRTAAVWDPATGKAVTPVVSHGGILLGVTFVGGECRALVGADEVARVWNVTRGGPATALLKHGGRINSGAFSRDGRLVVTAGDDGLVRVWDAASGDPVTPGLVHGTARRSGYLGGYGRSDLPQVAFTPEGDRVVVASWAGIRVWNLKPASRPVDELVLQAQITSGARIDGTGAHVPLDTEALRAAWEKLRK